MGCAGNCEVARKRTAVHSRCLLARRLSPAGTADGATQSSRSAAARQRSGIDADGASQVPAGQEQRPGGQAGRLPPPRRAPALRHSGSAESLGEGCVGAGAWRPLRIPSYPSVAEKLLVRPSRNLPPAIPASLKSCPKVVDQLLREPGFGPTSTQIGRFGPTFG